MKFRPFVSVTLLCLVALAGCGKKEEKTKIGFLVKQPEEPWFQYEWKGAEKAGAQRGFEVIKLGVPDGEKVIAAIDNLATLGAKGFVICTPDVRLGPAIVSKAGQAGLKVVTVDDQFVDANGKLLTAVPYLGMSATNIGRQVGDALAAELKKRNWPAEDTALCVITFEQLETIHQRTEGAIAALTATGFPAARVFKAAQKTQDIPGSFDGATILFTQHPEIKRWLICGGNDTAVLGAVRATEQRGLAPENVIGIGINGTDCVDELRKTKPTGFFGSMYVSAPFEGFRTAEMVYQWAHDGVTPPPDTRTPGTLITRENFETVLRQDGIIP
jgi:L-arabinose transport system substrate-binding protein